jgi:hypothetical protein
MLRALKIESYPIAIYSGNATYVRDVSYLSGSQFSKTIENWLTRGATVATLETHTERLTSRRQF